jgi:putative ABC transport system ATP-binding protein
MTATSQVLPTSADALFSFRDVCVERSDQNGQVRAVLRGVTIEVPAAGISCIVGPSGSGKTTLLRLLNRLEEPTRGTIALRGVPLPALDPLAVRRRVGMVLQTPVMLPGTVRDNLEAGLRLQGRTARDPGRWLERVGLSRQMLERDARSLSGGEKQRVSLLRTLMTEPEALLLDEVTASLDESSAALIEALIVESGLPALWVSHDMDQVRRVASRVYRLEGGSLKEEAVP